jgi:cytochrome c556
MSGVMQLGEMLDVAVGITRSVPGMVKSVRGQVEDANAVARGHDPLDAKDLLAADEVGRVL